MSTIKNILLQFDTDSMASSFDAVVAMDSGVDTLLQYPQVGLDNVTGLVHGAMFTRSPSKLKHTAIFVGGSNIEAAQALYHQITQTFFGSIRVSVVMDANGCNTTSVAAVERGFAGLWLLDESVQYATKPIRALVMGGTGPVGQRIATLLLDQGCNVVLHTRSAEKGAAVIERLRDVQQSGTSLELLTETGVRLQPHLSSFDLVFNASAAGVQAVDEAAMTVLANSPGVIVDLNAVPPAGIHGVTAHDHAKPVGQRLLYGALAVGAEKMKLHRAVIQACFRANDQEFNLREIAALNATRKATESPTC
jgi:hypothetical protein